MPATFRPLKATGDTLEKLLAARPVLWVGAGMSMAAGYPSTWDLVMAMRDQSFDEIPEEATFTEVADAFIDSTSRGELSNLLNELIGPAHDPTPAHRAIARLAKQDKFAAIITTNYDTLLERVLADEQVDHDVQTLETGFELKEDKLRVYKIHGTQQDWQETMLSGESYATFNELNRRLTGQLTRLLTQRRVMFVGCSMKDPRILDWIDDAPDEHLQGLQLWSPVMPGKNWEEALEESHRTTTGAAVYGQLPSVRPMLLDNHGQLQELLVELAPSDTPGGQLQINIRFEAGWTASMDECDDWQVALPAEDDLWLLELEKLRRLDHQAVLTDEHGVPQGEFAAAAGAIRELAAQVGQQLTERMLSKQAREELARRVSAAEGGEEAWLAIRVEAPDEGELQHEADRLLALPWELLRVGEKFPVEQGTLDITREAVRPEMQGLVAPEKPLSVVATVAAPVDSTTLDHEGESYRLWKAMGAREHALQLTDLGTLDALIADVEDYKPPVVHFTGHGMPGHLLFETPAAESDMVSVDGLVTRLRDAGFPRLIYLASCYGATPHRGRSYGARPGTRTEAPGGGEREPDRDVDGDEDRGDAKADKMTDPVQFAAPPATSTAAALHRAGLPQVVAYFGPVGDEQSTRAEAEFYARLSEGRTARAAVRAARILSGKPATVNGKPHHLYPLGWAQLALYHRGDDLPTTTAIARAAQLPAIRDDSRRRKFDHTHRIARLQFGFIGRRKSRSELYRRWAGGQRLAVVQGLGGLGKTTLCTEMLPILAKLMGKRTQILALDGRAAGQSDDAVQHLWQQMESATSGDAWNQELAALQENGITGEALADAIRALHRLASGPLLVYLDDAESLQTELGEGELAAWKDEQLAAFWNRLSSATQPDGSLALLASCRYSIDGLDSEFHVPLPPMGPGDTVKLLRWFPTLSRAPREDQDWLATQVVDGHPRTAEFLEELAARRERKVVGPSGKYTNGDWRGDILNPILGATATKVSADLLLPKLWEALEDEERELLGRCSVLDDPAPWEAIQMLGASVCRDASATAERLSRAGLLSPIAVGGDQYWWSPHRLVAKFVAKQWNGDAAETHTKLGRWYQQQFDRSGAVALAHRAVDHLLAAGLPNEAWPAARVILIPFRDAGRDREAQVWLRRILDHGPTGAARGLALTFDWQLRRRAGVVTRDGEACLKEAEGLVAAADKSFVLNELSVLYRLQGKFRLAQAALEKAIATEKDLHGDDHVNVGHNLHALATVLQDLGDLKGAKACHERSLEIKAKAYGTEINRHVAASMHGLARVLQAQGDLEGAKSRFVRSLEILRKLFGTDLHPDVASSLHELATVFQAQGDLNRAIFLMRKVLAIEEQIYDGSDHYSTAMTEVSLGVMLLNSGKNEEGLGLIVHGASVFRTALGEQHPLTQQAMEILAQISRTDSGPDEE